MPGSNIPGFGHLNPTEPGDDVYLPGGGLYSTETPLIDPCLSKIDGEPSPAFLVEMAKKKLEPLRRLIVNGVDLSSRVTRWPSFRRDTGKLKPVALSIGLSNADKTLNYFLNTTTEFNKPVTLAYGVIDPACMLAEYLTLFSGTLDTVEQENSVLTLGLMDKFKSFADIKLGTKDTPLVFASEFAHDLVWEIVTVHGGLDATTDATNVDINYTAWAEWSDAFVTDNIKVGASYGGLKIVDALQELAELGDSVFSFERSKLTFSRNEATLPADVIILTDTDIVRASVKFDDKKIINTHTTFADLDVVTGEYNSTGTHSDPVSIAAFGTKEVEVEPKSSWLIGSVSATNLSERVVIRESEPLAEYEIYSTLRAAHVRLNSGVRFTDDQLDVDVASVFRVSGITHNVDTGSTRVRILPATNLIGFRLDYDVNSNSLGILDHNHNVLL